jgi:hypothetical protein
MLRVSLQEATAAHLTPLVPEVELDADVAALRLAYSSDAWTWRR